MAALNATLVACGTLDHLPDGVLHRVGGLLPHTARELEKLMRRVQAMSPEPLTVGRIMAEVDEHLRP